MSEEIKEELISKKELRFIAINAAVVFVVGLILLLLGYNIYFNELFYYNEQMYAIFSVITNLGDLIVYIIIITVAWYAYDKKVAKNLAFSLLLGGAYANALLKDIWKDPRPWTRREVTGYGFPSGHSQSSVTVYGYLAHDVREKNRGIAIIFVILFYVIAISRVIIGVHDIQDIWGGLLFGMLFLTLFIILEPRASAKINALTLPLKILLVIIIPLILFIVAVLIFPPMEQGYGMHAGAMIGLGLGYIIECEKIGYDPTILSTKQRLLNMIIGLLVVFALYFLLNFIPLESVIWELIEFFILSFLLTTLNPWIFNKIQKK
ncbi:MAG: phosphatase PAP2 family protein [Promethearchaeota archaeon]